MKPMEVGVFLCNLGIADTVEALKKAKEIGFRVVQLGPDAYYSCGEPAKRNKLKREIKGLKMEVTTVFAGFEGEDYSDVPAVIRTVGFLNKDRVRERVELSKQIADFTAELGVRIMAAHVGFIPPEGNTPEFKMMYNSVCDVVDYCAERGLMFSFETGQEKPEELLHFIKKMDRRNARVNFDTANLLLYGKSKALPGIEILKDYIINVHAKDGYWPKEKDKIGEQAPIGQGEAELGACVKKLAEVGYKGPLIIEREAGEDRIGDILRAKEYLEKAKKEAGL